MLLPASNEDPFLHQMDTLLSRTLRDFFKWSIFFFHTILLHLLAGPSNAEGRRKKQEASLIEISNYVREKGIWGNGMFFSITKSWLCFLMRKLAFVQCLPCVQCFPFSICYFSQSLEDTHCCSPPHVRKTHPSQVTGLESHIIITRE